MNAANSAWESLANNMRLYSEASAKFHLLFKIDPEEAVSNLDRAFDAKLESFHRLYDVTKNLPGFDYFSRGDTSLLIVLRNALHHRDHSLFVSWNSMMRANGGVAKKAGAQYLLANYDGGSLESSKYFLPLHDFYLRLANSAVKNPTALKTLWDAELSFAAIAIKGQEDGYPDRQVYVNVISVFISAMTHVVAWMAQAGISATGYDGNVYLEHFSAVEELDLSRPTYMPLRIHV